jgi:hypothetical protein
MQLETSEMAPGTIGALIDDVPLLIPAMVRPYVIAITLHRGALRRHELIAALTPHLAVADMQTGAWSSLEGDYVDNTRVELVCDEVIGEFVRAGRLWYNDTKDMWTATDLGYWITKATELDATVPFHLLKQVDTTKLRSPF